MRRPRRCATAATEARVSLGGRRVAVSRPRVRAADGSGEPVIASRKLFTCTEIIGRMAMAMMLAGLSTRRYRVGLQPVGQKVAETCAATSKSAVSGKFVAMTETALAALLAADLSGLDLVALTIDGLPMSGFSPTLGRSSISVTSATALSAVPR